MSQGTKVIVFCKTLSVQLVLQSFRVAIGPFGTVCQKLKYFTFWFFFILNKLIFQADFGITYNPTFYENSKKNLANLAISFFGDLATLRCFFAAQEMYLYLLYVKNEKWINRTNGTNLQIKKYMICFNKVNLQFKFFLAIGVIKSFILIVNFV